MPIRLPTRRRTARREPSATPKRFTRQDCQYMVDSELLQGRYELIDGEIISKTGQKPPR